MQLTGHPFLLWPQAVASSPTYMWWDTFISHKFTDSLYVNNFYELLKNAII